MRKYEKTISYEHRGRIVTISYYSTFSNFHVCAHIIDLATKKVKHIHDMFDLNTSSDILIDTLKKHVNSIISNYIKTTRKKPKSPTSV